MRKRERERVNKSSTVCFAYDEVGMNMKMNRREKTKMIEMSETSYKKKLKNARC